MTPDTSVYTDLSSFTSLRAQAQSDPNAALDQVAEQFESIFVQMMMKSMRDASEPLESSWAGSSQMKSYQQMFDQQLSLDLSSDGGLGLAEIIASQLGGADRSGEDKTDDGSSGGKIGDLSRYQGLLATYVPNQPMVSLEQQSEVSPETKEQQPIVPLSVERETVQLVDLKNEGVSQSTEDLDWFPDSPKEFVDSLWGLAKNAGAVLGLNPKVILAQAALETGWGKHMIQNSDGSNSFNLFGIKGGSEWSGSEATVSTLEYVGGIAERQIANFRSYESLADAFKDYVNFLEQSPRYEQALNAQDDQGFLAGLQDGGYATDPNYAEKILGILNRPEFDEVSAEISNSQEMPL